MLKLLLLSLLCSNAFSAEIGREITYTVRSLGSTSTQLVTETVIERDEDFEYHKVKFDSPSTRLSEWRGDSIYRTQDITELLKNCIMLGGEYKTIVVDQTPHTTCKINGYTAEYNHRHPYARITNKDFDPSSNFWIGHGPYNGIFQVTSFSRNEVYKIVSFK